MSEARFWRMEAERADQHVCTDYELCPDCHLCVGCCASLAAKGLTCEPTDD